MKIIQLIKNNLKLDFTSTIVELYSGTESSNPFQLSARDFLRFAKADFKSNDKKGNINALTNAKRAIDCQIDTAFTLFGIKYNDIPSSSMRIVELTDLNKTDLPHKLRLIQALDFAPSGLISRTRTLRNKLEHYYKNPNKEEVSEAIELAELFVLSIESHIKLIEDQFRITDRTNYDKNWSHKNYIAISYIHSKKEMNLDFYVDKVKIDTVILNENDKEYYAFIKIINNITEEIETEDAMKVFLKMIDHPIPEKNIKLELK